MASPRLCSLLAPDERVRGVQQGAGAVRAGRERHRLEVVGHRGQLP